MFLMQFRRVLALVAGLRLPMLGVCGEVSDGQSTIAHQMIRQSLRQMTVHLSRLISMPSLFAPMITGDIHLISNEFLVIRNLWLMRLH
jgi:hypothetical protein